MCLLRRFKSTGADMVVLAAALALRAVASSAQRPTAAFGEASAAAALRCGCCTAQLCCGTLVPLYGMLFPKSRGLKVSS